MIIGVFWPLAVLRTRTSFSTNGAVVVVVEVIVDVVVVIVELEH